MTKTSDETEYKKRHNGFYIFFTILFLLLYLATGLRWNVNMGIGKYSTELYTMPPATYYGETICAEVLYAGAYV